MSPSSERSNKAIQRGVRDLTQAAHQFSNGLESMSASSDEPSAQQRQKMYELRNAIIEIKRIAAQAAAIGNAKLPKSLENIPRPIAPEEVLAIQLSELPGVSNRVRHALSTLPIVQVAQRSRRAVVGVAKLGELAQLSAEDLLEVPNLGAKSLREILSLLGNYGLAPGSKFPVESLEAAGITRIAINFEILPPESELPAPDPLPQVQSGDLVRNLNEIARSVSQTCHLICSTLLNTQILVRTDAPDPAAPLRIGELAQLSRDDALKAFRQYGTDAINDFLALEGTLSNLQIRFGLELPEALRTELGLGHLALKASQAS